MTLAKILVLSVLIGAEFAVVCIGDAQESSQPESSAKSQNSREQSSSQTADQAKSPSGKLGATKQTPAKNGAKKIHHKKKSIEECTPAPDATVAKPGTQPSQGDTALTTATTAQTQSTAPTKKCPPAKIVVNQGGATDSSIQLAGGAPKQTSQAHATADPMLDETESNLKKLEGRQLSSSEQDMVTQIRQFIEQSKTAVAAGDVERARTLAWKAQTLSEDLVKPEKQ